MTEKKKAEKKDKVVDTAKIEETQTPKKRKITGDTEVLVYNNTSGQLLYSAKKGNGYLEMDNPMDSDIMTVDELQQMRNGHRKMLEDGWIYVDDEDVLDYLRLGKVKDKVKSPDTLRTLVTSGNHKKIVEVVENLGASSKVMLYKIMEEEYKKGKLTNVHTIKEVEKMLKTNTSLLDD